MFLGRVVELTWLLMSKVWAFYDSRLTSFETSAKAAPTPKPAPTTTGQLFPTTKDVCSLHMQTVVFVYHQ